MTVSKLVIFLVGPPRTGKSAISDFLADFAETLVSTEEYHPTQGVRILEFDRTIKPDTSKKDVTVACELWDCSGDTKFQPCWPAVANGANAVIYVMAGDIRIEREMEDWYRLFPNLTDKQMTIFAYGSTSSSVKKPRIPSSSPLGRVSAVVTAADAPDALKAEFDAFLVNVWTAMQEKAEREEQSLMT
ncbi:hypothetical protein DFS34DRAFT_236827 [Phlyctochytrium arcticum]|nr:hypothetical protein DFS34DRAFT_236827 [Phlyctochytrium arcticum]